MSKPISQEEYQKKWLNRVTQWIRGEADPYLGNIEMKKEAEHILDAEILESHKADQDRVKELVFDTESNKFYKGFFRFYKVTAVLGCLALITILFIFILGRRRIKQLQLRQRKLRRRALSRSSVRQQRTVFGR